MRFAFTQAFCATLLALAGTDAAFAEEACTVAGASYASGAALCQPTVRDGRVEQVLFTCADGAWSNTGAACPDRYAYFCRVGPHAVAIGEKLTLGAGPSAVECRFPGVLQLTQDSMPVTVAAVPSLAVRAVQLFLSSEGAGLDCSVDACDGQADAKTMAALAAYVRANFAALGAAERAEFGATDAGRVEAVLLARSPIDVVPVFARIFDVPAQ